ncbi:hypothetical protein PSN45_002666 [Yamadazyma tenuis]|uniref:Flavin reductase like domain-containing protein n=1 Tax=Candida tenuis (strain ATCC 10573 / BCRC 21748 / CBS 615 / JCM 9827 / NBRC 10315 / NRRL Y-1498 / VKM Y-70) TaxID=590646 RepID=G3AX81_CANTC|nr:uncharacterized protein CANTEDRAFT_112449 [Yamadazyma tenuis ATCC 10573]EGV66714.1 hypothetical protein CANTEDRAFT_112449 [Yamadazyma tenuis ATCC 10573]WEJ95153.1 hypothetical protein PSN45_002666 [Yamadazyma tenuis]
MSLESTAPPFDTTKKYHHTQTPNPQWTPGSGASSTGTSKKIELDPYASDRSPVDNYKLLVSAVTPRPIGFVSTISANGDRNLAPFSFFSTAHYDPPIFTVGFCNNQGGAQKDTLVNILQTKECTINIISEWFVEAANHTCIGAPYEVDEWELSGLTPASSTKVNAPHVAESAFSVECKLIHSHEWTSKVNPDSKTGVLCIFEGINFHIGEAVINEERNLVDIAKLQPVSRLGGMSYGRTTEGYELPRPDYTPRDS